MEVSNRTQLISGFTYISSVWGWQEGGVGAEASSLAAMKLRKALAVGYHVKLKSLPKLKEQATASDRHRFAR